MRARSVTRMKRLLKTAPYVCGDTTKGERKEKLEE